METHLETNKDSNNPVIEDEKLKTAAKKGVSITVSLVMLGFSGWKDLEPGICLKYLIRILNILFYVYFLPLMFINFFYCLNV